MVARQANRLGRGGSKFFELVLVSDRIAMATRAVPLLAPSRYHEIRSNLCVRVEGSPDTLRWSFPT